MKWLEDLTPREPGRSPIPASAPGVIAHAVAAIGQEATAWAVETAAEIIEIVAADFSAAGTPGMMTGSEREGCEACLLTTLVGLHRGTPASEIAAPNGAQENVRLSVRQGVPIGNVLRTVWASHTRVQDALLAVLEEKSDPARMILEVRVLNAALFSYVNSYVRDLMAGYEDEISLWHGRLPAERLRIMLSILDGEEPAPDAERILGMRFAKHHVVALAWPESSGHQSDKETALDGFGAKTAKLIGASGTLTLHREGTTCIWWTFTESPGPQLEHTLRDAPRPAWLKLAVGPARRGLAGLRESHQGARQMETVGRIAAHGRFWDYGASALLALLIADREAAGRFVRSELAGLLGTDPRLADLRETVRQFLHAGSSRLVAAQALHLATNTVAYRVKRAGEQLGRPVGERAIETLMALELAHVFPDLAEVTG